MSQYKTKYMQSDIVARAVSSSPDYSKTSSAENSLGEIVTLYHNKKEDLAIVVVTPCVSDRKKGVLATVSLERKLKQSRKEYEQICRELMAK